MWFYFTVSNVRAEQRIIFNIVNFSKTKSLYRDGMSPLVKSTSRKKWYITCIYQVHKVMNVILNILIILLVYSL